MHAYAVFPKRCIKSHPPPVLDSSIKKTIKIGTYFFESEFFAQPPIKYSN